MKHLRLLAPALLAATSVSFAQSTSGAGDPTTSAVQPTPLFRSGVDLVRLDVRVTDADGRPITDLRADELQIEEEGTPRPILLFQHIEAPQGTYNDVARRTVAAEVSTNQGSPRGHVYVLVFDQSHIVPGHEQRARLAAERFLRQSIRPGDRVALYALPGPGPQIDFTPDARGVAKELVAVRGMGEDIGTGALGTMRTYEAYEISRGNSAVLARMAERLAETRQGADSLSGGAAGRARISADLTEDPSAVRRAILEDARSIVARTDSETRRFLATLVDVIKTLRAVDGRKAVILFSEGFEIDNVTHELEDVAAAAAQSYSVLYAMDLNPRTLAESEDAPGGGERLGEIRSKLLSLGSLTAETDGVLVNDAVPQLDRALARIAQTSEDYYLVGFASSDEARRDRSRYRRIRVKVKRAGATVSSRTGYALAPAPTAADRRRTIDAALRAPFSQQGLKVEYTTYVLRGASPDVQRVIVSLAAELPLGQPGGTSADIVYVVRDVQTGKAVASGTDVIPLPDAPAGPGRTTGTGLYRVQFEVPPGTYLMRAIVREPGGLLGSADRRFQVRALGGPDITASDLVLGSADVAGLPVRAAAHESEVLGGVLEVYGRVPSQLENVVVSADLVPLDGGAALVSSRADLEPVVSRSSGAARGARIELPLLNVPPGAYLVRAVVRKGSEAATELFREVRVNAGPRPAPVAAAPAPFRPLDVLQGEIARRFVQVVLGRVKGTRLETAADAAAEGNWVAVDSALGSGQPALRQTGPAVASPDEDTLRGLAAFARGDYAAAANALRAAHARAPADAALAFILGWAHAAAGDDRAAITAWRNAVMADATLVPPYLALVDRYLRLDQPGLAMQVVRDGLRTLPGSPELLDRLARLERRP